MRLLLQGEIPLSKVSKWDKLFMNCVYEMAKKVCVLKVDVKFAEFSKDKEGTIEQILQAICALLNTKGGELEICLDQFSRDDIHKLIRITEQRCQNIIGALATSEKIVKRKGTLKSVSLAISALDDYLCTLSYNVFLRSTVQSQSIEPNEPVIVIERIVEGHRRPCGRVQTRLGTHRNVFAQGEQFSSEFDELQRNIICKSVKEGRSVKDEMTNKQSKFKRQVSELANDSGGHIYHGINKSGKVVGVLVKENESQKIVSKVQETLGNMTWGRHEKPIRGRHWDIYFEPVKDENNDIIAQTFVIVVSVAPYEGGVFITEPQCFHVVHGEVESMDFNTWKKELLRRRTLRECKSVDEHVNALTFPRFDGQTSELLTS